jgi:hypothetical protein
MHAASPRRSTFEYVMAFASASALVAIALGSRVALADAKASSDDSVAVASAPFASADGLEHLVPELAGNPYHLDAGVRPYLRRLALSPGFGSLGSERLFVLRVAYSPNSWLGYEAAIGHNPSQAVHAIAHTFSAIVRRPLAGRIQPYLAAGYGMFAVLPGRSLGADPVTKNSLSFGGGLEFYVRGDLALRVEARRTTLFGRQSGREGVVTFDYFEQTVGLSFYRTLKS